MLVIPYQPVRILLFSQSILKGNAKHYCNHSPKEIPDEKHLSVTERIRANKFFTLIFEYVFENVIWCQYKVWTGWHKLRQLMSCLLKAIKIILYHSSRTLRQVISYHDEFLPLLYYPLLISSLNQRYFPIIHTYNTVLLCFGQINPERNSICH